MLPGFTLAQFTALHVLLSLVAIVSGGWVMIAYAAARGRLPRLTAIFLLSSVLTTITGFLFPFHGVTPAIATGVVSAVVLILVLGARYLVPASRRAEMVFAVGATFALYLNVFVLVVQLFLKVPVLHALAPTGTEGPFLAAQVLVLALHGVLGLAAWRRARSASFRGRG